MKELEEVEQEVVTLKAKLANIDNNKADMGSGDVNSEMERWMNIAKKAAPKMKELKSRNDELEAEIANLKAQVKSSPAVARNAPMLVIKSIEAHELPAVEYLGGKNDNYAKICFKEFSLVTSTLDGAGADAVWNDLNASLDVENTGLSESGRFKIEVWDENSMARDTLIGEADIDATDVVKTGIDKTFKVQLTRKDMHNTKRGWAMVSVHLEQSSSVSDAPFSPERVLDLVPLGSPLPPSKSDVSMQPSDPEVLLANVKEEFEAYKIKNEKEIEQLRTIANQVPGLNAEIEPI